MRIKNKNKDKNKNKENEEINIKVIQQLVKILAKRKGKGN